MAILKRFSAIFLYCDSNMFLLLAPEFLAIPGPRFYAAKICIFHPYFDQNSLDTQWVRRDILMLRDKNCRETIFVSQLSCNCPHRAGNFERAN